MKTKIIQYIKHNIILLSIILVLIMISTTFIYKYSNQSSKSSQGFTDSKSSPEVKKSSTGICHQKGVSNYYEKTKNFTAYDSLEECLSSGGRLPKR